MLNNIRVRYIISHVVFVSSICTQNTYFSLHKSLTPYMDYRIRIIMLNLYVASRPWNTPSRHSVVGDPPHTLLLTLPPKVAFASSAQRTRK